MSVGVLALTRGNLISKKWIVKVFVFNYIYVYLQSHTFLLHWLLTYNSHLLFCSDKVISEIENRIKGRKFELKEVHLP